MTRIMHKQIPEIRADLLLEQGGTCPLCLEHIPSDQAALDHSHKTGRIRMVLHRGCNAAEGRVLKGLARSGIKDPETFLIRLVHYWALPETEMTHPTHKTPQERQEALKKRQKRKRALRNRQE